MKNKSISVSVNIIAHNAGEYIEQCIDSVLAQNFNDFEIIIVDDASTDNTLRILDKYRAFSNVEVLKNENKRGVSYSRNKAMRVSSGKYIAILDADDICYPNRLNTQSLFLDAHPDVHLVSSKVDVIDKDSNIIYSPRMKVGYASINLVSKEVLWICHSTCMFRNIGDANIFYRKKIVYAPDLDLVLRILQKKLNIFVLKDVLVKYRLHNKQISTDKRFLQVYYGLKVKQLMSERIETGGDSYEDFDGVPESDPLYDSDLHNFHFKKRIIIDSIIDHIISRGEIMHYLIQLAREDGLYVFRVKKNIIIFAALFSPALTSYLYKKTIKKRVYF